MHRDNILSKLHTTLDTAIHSTSLEFMKDSATRRLSHLNVTVNLSTLLKGTKQEVGERKVLDHRKSKEKIMKDLERQKRKEYVEKEIEKY